MQDGINTEKNLAMARTIVYTYKDHGIYIYAGDTFIQDDTIYNSTSNGLSIRKHKEVALDISMFAILHLDQIILSSVFATIQMILCLTL